MLENIHDIAPGRQPCNSPRPSSASSASRRTSWPCRRPGRNVIVDDVHYSDEPIFPGRRDRAGDQHGHGAGRHLFQRPRETKGPTAATCRLPGRQRHRHGHRLGHVHELQSQRRRPTCCCRSRHDSPIADRHHVAVRPAVPVPGARRIAGCCDVERQHLRHRRATGNVVVGPAANQNNVATQQPCANYHDPERRQLFCRDPGRVRGQPRAHRIRRRQRHERHR